MKPQVFSKAFLSFFTLIFCFTILTPVHAQKEIKKKRKEYQKDAKRQTERRIDNAVDDVIDSGLDAIFKKKKKKKHDEDDVMVDSEIYDEIEEANRVNLEDDDIAFNDFTGSFTMKYEVKTGGEVNHGASGTAIYHFDRFKSVYQPLETDGTKNVTMIYDLEKRTMTTVQDRGNVKSAVILKRPAVTVPKQDETAPKITRLSSTRTIQGHQCYKYLVEKQNEIITLWVAEDLVYNFHKLMLSVQNQNKKSEKAATHYSNQISGMPLQMTIESKTEDEAIVIDIRALEIGFIEPSLFDLSGCQVTDMTDY